MERQNLAHVFARAERRRGRPLTEEEQEYEINVHRIRARLVEFGLEHFGSDDAY